MEIDLPRRPRDRAGEEVHLTPTEFDLLRVLVRNRGRLLTHRAMLKEVWGPGFQDDTQVLRVHIANLRRKIEPEAGRPSLIRTDPGRRLPLRNVGRHPTGGFSADSGVSRLFTRSLSREAANLCVRLTRSVASSSIWSFDSRRPTR